ncbi:MAG: hypothetical protein ABH971_00760 [bacterium]
MLSEFIRSVHSYSAVPLAGTTDRPEVRSIWSSRRKTQIYADIKYTQINADKFIHEYLQL